MASRRKWSGDWHPLAARFPMLDEDDLRGMAVSIAEHGQFVPCRMDATGLGLDGRNRVAACALAEVEPSWEVYDGDSIAFIVEVNGDRRHWTTGQRAMATAIGLVDEGKRSNGRFARDSVPANASSSVRAWAQAVQRAGVVLDHAPELADEVLHGRMALDEAHKKADAERKKEEWIGALGSGPDLSETLKAALDEVRKLYDAGVIDLAEAERRAGEAGRLDDLPDDLAQRVRDGGLALDEAELIAKQNAERLTEWADRIREALGVLGRMAGYPIPPGLADRLSDEELAMLEVVLPVIPRQTEEEK